MMSGKKIGACLAAALILMLVAALFWTNEPKRKGALENTLATTSVRREEPHEPSAMLQSRNSGREVSEESGSTDDQQEPERQAITARLYLQEYWGDRWPEIEQAMLKAKIDLDQPYEPVPWETAAAVLEPMVLLTPSERTGMVANLCRWPTDLEPRAMRDWLRKEFAVPRSEEIDDTVLLAIDDIVRGPNEELGVLAKEWSDRIDFYYLERWRSGDFVKAPFGTIGVSKELGFSSKTAAASGWSFVITLTRERYPDMVELEERAADIREARDRAVTQYLRERFAR